MKYYKVDAKCGHVGMNNYIIKSFYVYAENGRDAAMITRRMPRVKHHQKDAIKSVLEITEEEYLQGKEQNNCDLYFHVKNSTDQRINCRFSDGDILREEKAEKHKKKEHKRQRIIESLTIKEWKAQWRYAYE